MYQVLRYIDLKHISHITGACPANFQILVIFLNSIQGRYFGAEWISLFLAETRKASIIFHIRLFCGSHYVIYIQRDNSHGNIDVSKGES
jgi:hypothetical protein